MQQLIGKWHGTGIATYPSIETTRYREILDVAPHGDDAILRVEQMTWRIHDDESESLLYWECGFIRQLSSTEYEWTNAQNNGRAEVLHGIIEAEQTSLTLTMNSKQFANDERMLASRRIFQVNGNQLTYEMWIATQAYPDIQHHLKALLTR